MLRNTVIVPYIKYIEIEGEQIVKWNSAILRRDDCYRIRIFTDSIHPDLLDIGVKYKSDSVYFWLPRNPMDSTCYPYVMPISRQEEIEIRCFSYDEYGDISFELPGVSWYFPDIEDPLLREATTDISQHVINVDFK